MPVRTVAVGPRAASGGSGTPHPFVTRILLEGTLDASQDVLDNRYSFPGAVTITRWHIQKKGAAHTADVVIDLLVSTDGGASFSSIFDSGDEVRLPAGDTEAAGTAFLTASFALDHKLRVDVLQGGGDDYEIYLKGTWD